MRDKDIMVTVNLQSIMDSGNWMEMCEKYGIDEYCMNEGIADEDSTIEISLEDAYAWNMKLG